MAAVRPFAVAPAGFRGATLLHKYARSRADGVTTGPAGPDIRLETSRRIQAARVLSIFFMTFAHVSPGIVEADFRQHGIRDIDVVFLLLASLAAKSAVPLLSIVSGWLLAETMTRRSYSSLLAGKVRTLLVPMMIWNAVLLVLMAAYVLVFAGAAVLPDSPMAWLNGMFGLTDAPANIHLAFLRDLFVCAVFAPLLMAAGRASPVGLLALLAAATVFLPANPVILRPEIVFFFTLGLLIATGHFSLAWVDRAAPYIAGVFAVLGAILLHLQMQAMAGVWEAPQWAVNLLVLTVRLSAALFFWWAAGLLLRTALRGWLMDAACYIFIVFCAHVILLKAAGVFGREVVGGYYGDWYWAYFLAQPFLAFAGGWAIYAFCRRYAPSLLALLLGRDRPVRIEAGRAGRSPTPWTRVEP